VPGASRVPSKTTITCSPVPPAATNSHSRWTVLERSSLGSRTSEADDRMRAHVRSTYSSEIARLGCTPHKGAEDKHGMGMRTPHADDLFRTPG
jgi:hypothetical protein